MASAPGALDLSENLSGTIVACAIVMPLVALLAVGLRFYARGILIHAISWEDWWILAALAFSVATSAWTIKESQVALGRHIAVITPDGIKAYLQAAWFMGLFYNLTLCSTKISILLLYLRVLTHDYIRKATYLTLTIIVIYNVWAFVMYFVMCTPLAKAWDWTLEGSCREEGFWWAIASLHIITDFMTFLLPIPVIATMTIRRRQKFGLLLVFAMGFFLCLVSLLRTLWLRKLVFSQDMTWDLTAIANWSTAEINVAIVCACLPTLNPLLKKLVRPLMQKFFSSKGNTAITIGSIPLGTFRKGKRGHNNGPAIFQAGVSGGTDGEAVGDNNASQKVLFTKDTNSGSDEIAMTTAWSEIEPPSSVHCMDEEAAIESGSLGQR